MCVFLISPVPIAEPLTSELIDTPVFYNLAPRPIKYRVSVPIPIPKFIKTKDNGPTRPQSPSLVIEPLSYIKKWVVWATLGPWQLETLV